MAMNWYSTFPKALSLTIKWFKIVSSTLVERRGVLLLSIDTIDVFLQSQPTGLVITYVPIKMYSEILVKSAINTIVMLLYLAWPTCILFFAFYSADTSACLCVFFLATCLAWRQLTTNEVSFQLNNCVYTVYFSFIPTVCVPVRKKLFMVMVAGVVAVMVVVLALVVGRLNDNTWKNACILQFGGGEGYWCTWVRWSECILDRWVHRYVETDR